MSAHAATTAPVTAAEGLGTPGAGVRRVRPMVLRWLGTVLLIAVVLSLVNRAELAALLMAARWELLLVALAVAMAERVVSTFRWWMLLRAKDIGVRFPSLVGLHMAASFAGSFLPTTVGADALRMAMLSRDTGRTVDCIAASIVDRVMMVLGTLVAAALAVFVAAALTPQLRWYIVGAAAVACAGTALAASRHAMRPVGAVARRVLGRAAAATLARVYWGMYEYRGRHGLLIGGAATTVLVLLIRAVYTWLIAVSMGVEVSLVSLIFVLPIIAAVMMLPISVGGLGLQEGLFVVLLGMVGVPPAAAVSMSLVEQVVSRLATAPGAVLLVARPRPPRPATHDSAAASPCEGAHQ